MRSNDPRRNVSGFARMIIGDVDDNRAHQTRNDDYPPLSPTIQYSKSSILRIQNGT